MIFLTKKKCVEIGRPHNWEYYRIVIKYLKIINPKNTFELGCFDQPIVLDGDTMDKNSIVEPTYVWDATIFPWPVKKKYDTFISLQVWEHLKGKQNKIFNKVSNMFDWAILSFPYKWKLQEGHSHNRINKKKISEWTFPFKPVIKPKRIRSRIIYIFNFSKKKNISKQIEKLILV